MANPYFVEAFAAIASNIEQVLVAIARTVAAIVTTRMDHIIVMAFATNYILEFVEDTADSSGVAIMALHLAFHS